MSYTVAMPSRNVSDKIISFLKNGPHRHRFRLHEATDAMILGQIYCFSNHYSLNLHISTALVILVSTLTTP